MASKKNGYSMISERNLCRQRLDMEGKATVQVLCQKVMDNSGKGCRWVYDIDDAIDVIREFSYATCTSYTVTRSSRKFGEFKLGHAKEEHVVRFKDDCKVKHNCRIPSDGTPFMIVGLRRMECHQGPPHSSNTFSVWMKNN
ncbi:uncharacterized protein LOC117319322 isoform X5 [Pecten maximus]|uniref:uncharacterized protein LOC117319322 isoform X5 n=1 Tax=Pecten maximus TaxID=6579 RepID=UPI00145856F6|nr:uncharacterized protein LOC117319322 isoform X5 [Pecten maximus]